VTARGKHWIFYMGMNERHDTQFVYGAAGPRLDWPNRKFDLPEWRNKVRHVTKRIGLVTYERDRITGLAANNTDDAHRPSWIRTHTFVLQGAAHRKALTVNAKIGHGGSIRVEVQHDHGKPIAGLTEEASNPIIDPNGEALLCTWGQERNDFCQDHDNRCHLKDKPIRLKFVLVNATLFSYRIKPRD